MSAMTDSQTPFSLFVTGTDTEIGKTLIAAALVHAMAKQGLSTAAMKPVAAGIEWRDGRQCNDDIDTLRSVASCTLAPEVMTPYLWEPPIAPHIAAAQAGVVMQSQVLLDAYAKAAQQAQAVVIEGVGGFCVPLSDTEDMADVAQRLGLPVVLVVGMRLGCISHAVLTAQAVAARGLPLCGWVANTVDPDMPYLQENLDTLTARLPAPFLGRVPRLEKADPAQAAQYIDVSRIAGWPA